MLYSNDIAKHGFIDFMHCNCPDYSTMHHQTSHSSTDLHSIEAVGEALSAADQVADPLDNVADNIFASK